MIDKIIQEFFKEVILSGNLNWKKFKIYDQDLNYYSVRELDIIRDYYKYYCVEDHLYVIKDTRLNSFYFTYASSPKGALKSFFLNKDSWGMSE